MVVHPNSAGAGGGRAKRGNIIGILCFEVATAMSRLVSLNISLSESGIHSLRSDTMRSAGVAYLTSTDQHFLFRLVSSDLLSQLDAAAAAVSSLAARCRSDPLLSFPRTYADVKAGRTASIRIFSSKGVHRRVRRMEKCIAAAAKLFEEMEALSDMEAGDKKTAKKKPTSETELKAQRKKVARLKEDSLWCKTFDEAVALMSRAVLAVFARICVVFGPFVPGLPPILIAGDRMSFTSFRPKFRIYSRIPGRRHSSGPMERVPAVKEVAFRNSCPIIRRVKENETKFPARPTSTVGGAGLAIRYANVVVAAARMLRMRCGEEETGEGDEAATRDEIYRLLPARLQWAIRRKLRERWTERGTADGGLAEGWKEAVGSILRWLEPVARDTVTWDEERTMDRRRRLDTKPRVLLIQTLEFSDREKTEAVIAEVIVGISCVCWYDDRNLAAAAAANAGDDGR
ncbi:hypothetical protein KSP39_PZI021797 [Platanthera zijinensis]|uniref:Uncharacterized protein n=1 Tax=Platanthera zijinensis TaxID=2320716 RepID=A0AAP0AX76_9ASPA